MRSSCACALAGAPAACLFLFLTTAVPPGASAECERPPGGFPPVPSAADLGLTAEETKALLAGEAVLKTVERTPEDRMARVLKLLDAHPAELFGVTSDSRLQPEMFKELVEFVEIEQCGDGKQFRATADVTWLLPNFHYVNRSFYNESGTAMTWTQLRGDFQRNDGNWTFYWHPASGKTLACLTLDLALKGILSLVPESLILHLTKNNLPKTLDRVVWMVGEMRKRDPERAAGWDRRWEETRPRLEAGELADTKPWRPEPATGGETPPGGREGQEAVPEGREATPEGRERR